MLLTSCPIPSPEIVVSVELSPKVLFWVAEFERGGKEIWFDLTYFSNYQCVEEKDLSYKAFPRVISLQKSVNSPIRVQPHDSLITAGALYPYDLVRNEKGKRHPRVVVEFEKGWIANEFCFFMGSPFLEGINYFKLYELYAKAIAKAPATSSLFLDSFHFREELNQGKLTARSFKIVEGGFWETPFSEEEEVFLLFCDPAIRLKDLKVKNKKGEWVYLLPPGSSSLFDLKSGKSWQFFCDPKKNPAVVDWCDRIEFSR